MSEYGWLILGIALLMGSLALFLYFKSSDRNQTEDADFTNPDNEWMHGPHADTSVGLLRAIAIDDSNVWDTPQFCFVQRLSVALDKRHRRGHSVHCRTIKTSRGNPLPQEKLRVFEIVISPTEKLEVFCCSRGCFEEMLRSPNIKFTQQRGTLRHMRPKDRLIARSR